MLSIAARLGYSFARTIRTLHSLWLAVDTGGLSLSSYVQPTLTILYSQALHDAGARDSNLTRTLARIVHAVMSALGPDLSRAGNVSVERLVHLWRHITVCCCSRFEIVS